MEHISFIVLRIDKKGDMSLIRIWAIHNDGGITYVLVLSKKIDRISPQDDVPAFLSGLILGRVSLLRLGC